jgi:2-oxoglutarate ferredoxin oxidoreductase subunit delta
MNEARGKVMGKKTLKEIKINRNWCKGCGICVHFCPEKVLEMDEQDKARVAHPEACICCMMCEMRCPDLAIEVIVESGGGEHS